MFENKFSHVLKKSFDKYKVDYQFSPPHIHRANAAERFICTLDSHFLAGMASCNPNFPFGEWDRLLEQAEIPQTYCKLRDVILAYLYIHILMEYMISIGNYQRLQALR